MASPSLDLHFANVKRAQPTQTRLCSRACRAERVAVRRKTPGAFREVLTLHRSAAVRGLNIQFGRATVVGAIGGDQKQAIASGSQGHLPSSLNYAFTKQPGRLGDMFATTACGRVSIWNIESLPSRFTANTGGLPYV